MSNSQQKSVIFIRVTLNIQHSKWSLIEQLEKVGKEQSIPERQCDGRRNQVKESRGSEWAAPTACKKLSFLLHWFGQDFSHWGESFQLNLCYFLCPQYANPRKTEQNLKHVLKLWPQVYNPTTSSGMIPTENKWRQKWNASSVSASLLKQISHIISSASKSDFT